METKPGKRAVVAPLSSTVLTWLEGFVGGAAWALGTGGLGPAGVQCGQQV